jgi:hypothetical protein
MSENTTEVVDTEIITDEEQIPVSTRIPELSNILLVGDEQFYINAKRAEEASKVSESLLINCVGPEEVTQVVYNGKRQKSVSVVPATGGTFLGPLFARSSVVVSEDREVLVKDNAVVVASDFKNLYEKHVKEVGAAVDRALIADKALIADNADKASSAVWAEQAGHANSANDAGHASMASIANQATSIQLTKTDGSFEDCINLYFGSAQPSDDVPIGSIWIKTKS